MEGAALCGLPGRARVRMIAQPASVPATRRFVDDVLTGWGREHLVDDVGLCVTELTTNVALHSAGRYFEVELRAGPGSVLVSVLDVGVTNAGTIAVRVEAADPLDALEADLVSTTGRGLFIVSMLASSWGVEDTGAGTKVWARFGTGEGPDGPATPQVSVRAGSTEGRSARDEDWVEVRLLDCPVALLLAHEDNLLDMIRELQLVAVHRGDALPARLAASMEQVVRRHAVGWQGVLAIARSALLRGQEYADIHVPCLRRPSEDLLVLQESMTEAERLAKQGLLMTLPAGPDVQRLRIWMAGELAGQAEHGSAPTPFRAWVDSLTAPR